MELQELPAAYASWRGSRLGQITDRLEQALILRLIGPVAGLRILDAGCGDGLLALELARRGASVTGIDASEQMIRAAHRRAQHSQEVVSFGTAAVEELPFAAGSFDVVLAVTVLCFVEDAVGAVRELARVLDPGGRLIVGELGRWSGWAAIRRIKGWAGSEIWRQARFRSPKDLRRLAAQAVLMNSSITGAVFYPPFVLAARALGPFDYRIGRHTTCGAAFLALNATNGTAASNVASTYDRAPVENPGKGARL